ncbi:hypothetical protein CYT13_09430, partial [Campylobacter coli]|nr:hypothetical protein [Campylobacter coli]EAK5690810.1 hypothetical protein [Campylobacter coli]
NKLYHYFNNKENSNDLKKQFFKNIKQALFYLFLVILTFYNITYLTLLTFFPFPFFGWISLFILSTIWVYLFLKLVFYLVFKIFNIDKKIKKFYLFLPYPLFMLLWFGYSFVPLEWQSSFKEFESLCEKADSKAVIYDAKNIISLWDNYKKINKDILFNITEQYVDFRIKKIIILWYYKDGKNTIQEYKIDNTYSWLDIGMFAKYKRKMICYDIQKYKELQEKRGY